MSRHSIEIKTLLENKKLHSSILQPETTSKNYISNLPTPKVLKRTESSSFLRKQPSCSMLMIEEKYRKL
jgi:hypothetical protein